MKQLVLTGKELLAIGFTESPAISIAIRVVMENFDEADIQKALAELVSVLENPGSFKGHIIWNELAVALSDKVSPVTPLSAPVNFTSFGEALIEAGARAQMETAVTLPIAVAGALMPDAHQGYGLPIGGVLATRNAVIPYGVGVDIGCRMCLSIFDITESYFEANIARFQRELIAHTKFGAGAGYHGRYKADHDILDEERFNQIPFVRQLKDKAFSQLGTSGGGNHFAEFGIIEILEIDNGFQLPLGNYLALLTHSGSRGMGATIANHYTKVAKSVCQLPKEASQLAYMDLNSEEGQEYWLAMNLAGDYASACHEVIHNKLTNAIGGKLLARVENHHNFAWKEIVNGEELIVHRKGATPAGKDVMGIIPGSMTAPAFLVRGKGELSSLNSASHGAGRQMSRTKANASFSRQELNKYLQGLNITLIGGGTDEAPGAYKDIHMVMDAQKDLVEILAMFQPKIVRMADDGSKED